ncbi:hypothetical protein Pcinc_030085 [Petrolisthes cinctipes]|uniref:Uncharacterized protein n=1 Tax=Petrolisthes cinctipes TaxID=88211 RepID=A0AAE1EZQ3_PETCI|nr:hypothetical protein Pcinc_030085 [Petrolisthes cinctipes]
MDEFLWPIVVHPSTHGSLTSTLIAPYSHTPPTLCLHPYRSSHSTHIIPPPTILIPPYSHNTHIIPPPTTLIPPYSHTTPTLYLHPPPSYLLTLTQHTRYTSTHSRPFFTPFNESPSLHHQLLYCIFLPSSLPSTTSRISRLITMWVRNVSSVRRDLQHYTSHLTIYDPITPHSCSLLAYTSFCLTSCSHLYCFTLYTLLPSASLPLLLLV